MFKFKADYPNVEERRQECNKIKNQYPDKIPIICEKDPKSKIQNIDKNKYLIPLDLDVSQFKVIISTKINHPNGAPFFLLANGKDLLPDSLLLSHVYEKYKDPEDGFLYIAYTSELQGQISSQYPQGQKSTKQETSKSNQEKFLPKSPQVQVQPKLDQSQTNYKNPQGQTFLFKYKADYPNVEERRHEYNKIKNQYPDKIPIICEKDPKSKI